MNTKSWNFDNSPFRSAPKLELDIYCNDKILATTNENFLYCPSPIIFDDLRAGEHYDARLERSRVFTSFSLKGFQKPLVVTSPLGEITSLDVRPITLKRKIKAKNIWKAQDGYIFDFGENNAGVVQLKFDGEHGQRVDLYFGECMIDGALSLDNISFEKTLPEYIQHDVYISKGGKSNYIPSFTYHGFRYVFVKGLKEEQINKNTLTYLVFSSLNNKRSVCKTTNNFINKLNDCILRSDASNFYHFPTDCPHREKNGWTADASLSCEQMLYNFYCENELKAWLCSIRKAQRADGAIPGIVPTCGWGFDWGNGPNWDNVIVELPYQIFKFTGDKNVIYENIDAIKKYFAYLETKINEDKLISFGLGDWVEAGTSYAGQYATPVEITDTLACVDMANKTIFMLNAINKTDEIGKIESFKENLLKNFRKKYIKNNLLTCNTQTAYCMALCLDVFPQKQTQKAYKHLKNLIKQNDNHFKVGVVGLRYLVDVLSMNGDCELVYKMFANKTFPSYRYLLDNGATTLWESFVELEKNSENVRKDGVKMPSLNHHFWGYPSAWLYKYVVGFNVNCGKIEIKPNFIKGIKVVEYHYQYADKEIFIKINNEKTGRTIFIENNGFDCVFEYGNLKKTIKGKDVITLCGTVIKRQ
jgi:alpha-L-rhamnosidase